MQIKTFARFNVVALDKEVNEFYSKEYIKIL